jgi:putative RecB family exonuclease
VIYSYSKLRSFSNCPLQFRFRYLDRIPVEHEGIEAFTGKRVHEVLEALYRALAADPEPPALEALLQLFDAAWERAWHPHVEVVRREATPADYQRMGKRCLATFYRGNWPFSGDRSLGLEVEMEFDLEREPRAPIRMRGIADRVAANESGELVIHDYKTSTYLPRKEEILADLQLAIYQLGARAHWPERRDPKLIWHFLAFGRRVTVRLGGPGIQGKETAIRRQVDGIENAVAAGRLGARVGSLCRWCAYRAYCPDYAEREGVAVLALPPPLPEPPPADRIPRADPVAGAPFGASRLELRPLETRGRRRARGKAALVAIQLAERQLRLI